MIENYMHTRIIQDTLTLRLESDSFKDGERIPQRFGYKHGNASPHLGISGIPDGTKSLAIIMDDPDAMQAVGKVWVHWVLWNLPPVQEIPESAVPKEASAGTNDFGESGYGGPAPPDREHTYVFEVYALDSVLGMAGGTRADLDSAMKGHILETARLTGTYAPDG